MFCKTSDGLKLHYEVHGDISSPKAIIFLNGLSQSTVAWGLIAPAFKDFKIILCDFIFQGQSEKIGAVRDFDQHAEDVKDLLDHLGVINVTPIGISYGSLVAQNFAVNYPDYVDRLILLSTFAKKTPYFNAIELSWRNALEAGGYDLMLDVMLPYVLSENYFSNPLIPIDILKASRKGVNEDKSALQKLMQATYERKDYLEKIKSVKAKTLVIHGEKDLLLPLHMGKEVADLINGAQFITVPNGHTLNLEAAEKCSQIIKEFLEKS